ncbi:L-ascorbate metabolism protein UlaG, beta-lactamase superfamily [Lutibacter agarilyticus]|uniref:L-ascorbate metabolism protein UlaG, beta-lactamase superfamily n=1 Tax=Lutibacter agarilyticus TaxID=1109740 RepID=A0A238WZY5_9FLAO|nr:MBL fold metallo-hydrolase [Lutibacter agarilyticus]SNR52225.1 L-ascorbate metabolism protein UlaG, beta-lactamase superfamily [Lutibacter agarilyticus]
MKPNKLTYLYIVLLLNIITIHSQTFEIFKTEIGTLKIQPILHGSMVLTFQDKTIYVDPYGDSKLYNNIKAPDIILITDIHGDHLDLETLDSINTSKAIFITPQAVADKLPEKYKSQINILNNGQGIHRLDFYIKAVPMYNLPVDPPSKKHPKGRGNGYLLNIDNLQIYISGDTEDIPEMRMLENIDIAFVCMNLPYTMTVEQAASAVLEFKPKVVYPYHYRGTNGLSDVKQFKKLVNEKNKNIEVRLANWYPKH